MDNPHALWWFFLMVLATVLLPGLDMLYVAGRSLAGGVSDGFIAIAGLVVGALVHVLVGVLGLATLLLVWPWAYNALLLLGAAYIAWVGFGLVRAASSVGTMQLAAGKPARSGVQVFALGMATNLLNPKAYMFMLAIFPQFFDPRQGHVVANAATLWLIAAACQLVVYGSVAIMVVRARDFLGTRQAPVQWLFRLVGIGLMLFAMWAILSGMHSTNP